MIKKFYIEVKMTARAGGQDVELANIDWTEYLTHSDRHDVDVTAHKQDAISFLSEEEAHAHIATLSEIDHNWRNQNVTMFYTFKVALADYAFANMHGYSDIEPFEIVNIVSDKTIEIRKMNCIEQEWDREFYAGGFHGHTANQHKQKWDIQSCEANPVVRIRKGKKGWKDSSGSRFAIAEQPRKFYDYNF